MTQGHFGETWGLYEQKSDNQFISCAYDNHVKMWDASQHKALWDIELEVNILIRFCCTQQGNATNKIVFLRQIWTNGLTLFGVKQTYELILLHALIEALLPRIVSKYLRL